jgi:hypothetical protein
MIERTKSFHFPAFEQTIEFVYTNSIPESRQKRNKRLGTLSKKLGDADGLTCYKDEHITIFIDTRATLGVIAHEVYHAACRMLYNIGVESYDEEIMSYHLGYLVDQIHGFIEKNQFN